MSTHKWITRFLSLILLTGSISAIAVTTGVTPPEKSVAVKKVEWPVSYNEQTAFTLSEAAGNKTAAERAQAASRALAAAIEAKQAASESVDVSVENSSATIRVRGFVISVVYPTDASAAGFPSLNDYAEHLKTVLQDYVPRQRQKVRLQSLFFRAFLSVFFAFLAFLILGQLRRIFDRLDHALDQRRGEFKPLVLVSETLLTGEAIGGILVVLLGIARVAAYGLTAIAAIAGILGQFGPTRNLLVTSISTGVTQIFGGLGNLVGVIPNLLLAVILALGLQAALRVLDMFLKGISSGRIRWHLVPPERVPVIRVFGSLSIILILAPLILGLLFGGFRSPYETVFLIAAGILGLAGVPVVAAYAVGASVLWNSRVRPGDWIEVGRFRGEISKIGLGELVIVPLDGGSLSIPMLTLLIHPLHRIHKPPGFQIHMELKPSSPIDQMIRRIKEAIGAEHDPKIEIHEFGSNSVSLTVLTTALKLQDREYLMTRMAEQMTSGNLEILRCRFL